MMPMRKRDLLETLANDDPSAFGYDKRKRFIDIEDDQDEDEDGSDGFEEVSNEIAMRRLPLAHLGRL